MNSATIISTSPNTILLQHRLNTIFNHKLLINNSERFSCSNSDFLYCQQHLVRCTLSRNMKFVLLILSFAASSILHSQVAGYNITKKDTIQLRDLHFKRTIAFYLDEAIVLFDYSFFLNKLKKERKGLKKQITSRERMIKKGTDYPGITSPQLKHYRRQYLPIDSVYTALKNHKTDTIRVDYSVFEKAQSPFGDFLPFVLEAKNCIILDFNHKPQPYIIKQAGSKKTGQTTTVSSSFYFLPAAKWYFWSKMDWVS